VCKRERELLSHLACLQVHAMQAEVRMCIATVHVAMCAPMECTRGSIVHGGRGWMHGVCVHVCACV